MCEAVSIQGEVSAGQAYERALGGGLEVWLQPIASGWILRVIPVQGPRDGWDYAQVATPPYHAVTPLSISTDFGFRAQDAIGWNPRRFRFAPDKAAYGRMLELERRLEAGGTTPSPELERAMAGLVASAPEGVFRIVDARLVPGTANQWRMAAAVASHFSTTAHTLEQPAGRAADPLGKVLWMRFAIELKLPPWFHPPTTLPTHAGGCEAE
jgi:hypothetical protein